MYILCSNSLINMYYYYYQNTARKKLPFELFSLQLFRTSTEESIVRYNYIPVYVRLTLELNISIYYLITLPIINWRALGLKLKYQTGKFSHY